MLAFCNFQEKALKKAEVLKMFKRPLFFTGWLFEYDF